LVVIVLGSTWHIFRRLVKSTKNLQDSAYHTLATIKNLSLMNILAISHTCSTDVNQRQFIAINDLPGVNVELLIPSNWRSDITDERFITKILPEVNFPVQRWPVKLAGNVSLHFYPKLPSKQQFNLKPDVVFSTQESWSLSGLQAALLAKSWKVPYVFVANQNILKRYPPPFSWIEQYHYRTAAAGVGYAEEARQVLLKKGLTKPSYVIPYGTDISLFSPGKATELRSKLGLENCVVIGNLGRLVPSKGLDTFLQVAKKLSEDASIPFFKCLLVGTGTDEERLQDIAAQLDLADRVIFTGSVPHLEAAKYLQCMDIFVLPSRTTPTWKEQFGRVIIESMACAVPVVGSDSGAIPFVIRDTGGGLVFREDDEEDFAGQLKQLLCSPDLRSELGMTGLASVANKFTFDAVARQWFEVFKNCLGR
jgi:glycosyltransferase involved in cell wall biosynthesis